MTIFKNDTTDVFYPIANIFVNLYNDIMTQGFFQFNSSIINEILNFCTSTFDLLFVSGPKGCAKSETVDMALKELTQETLIFRHFCFKNSLINDFLLNFYDDFRKFSMSSKISLKKFTTDNFEDKVVHYFKSLNIPCLIVIENFECIENNIEIVNFLSHLASFDNVKIIITSRTQEKNIFRYRQTKVQSLSFKNLSKEEFEDKLTALDKPYEQDFKDKVYETTLGLELYLKMSLKYCSTTNIELIDLIDEYERKTALNKETYEQFLIAKFISLTPNIYLSSFRTLCLLSHPVSLEFIKNYGVGKVEYIEYLKNNFLVSSFEDEIYVKDYFKQYVLPTFSIQEKITNYKNLIQIYELELTKSPKDRLLRLSRESIRKEIEDFKSLMPSITTSQKASKNLPYLGFNSWNTKENQKNKLKEKLDKIKERKALLKDVSSKSENSSLSFQKRLDEELREKNTNFIISLINSARELNKNYKYNEAIEELKRAQETDEQEEFKIEILLMLAKNYQALNNTDFEYKCYKEAYKTCRENKDTRRCEIEFLVASFNKRLYKINIAKTQFEQIAYSEQNSSNYRARAFLELGEIEEAQANLKDAIKQYERGLSLSLGKNKELVSRAYYRLAVLYDENQDSENAIKYYQKNYLTSSEIRENKYYSVSLVNLAQIYIEASKFKEASEFLKLALQFDLDNNDLENVYFSQKELANLYSKTDSSSAIGYYKQALDTALKLKDKFKEAIIYFEVGEYYCDQRKDESALLNFLNSKKLLIELKDKENIERINSRIKDIKIRLDHDKFIAIMEKYDKR